MHEQPYALTICILRHWGALAESGVFHFAGGKQRWAIQQKFAFISMFNTLQVHFTQDFSFKACYTVAVCNLTNQISIQHFKCIFGLFK